MVCSELCALFEGAEGRARVERKSKCACERVEAPRARGGRPPPPPSSTARCSFPSAKAPAARSASPPHRLLPLEPAEPPNLAEPPTSPSRSLLPTETQHHGLCRATPGGRLRPRLLQEHGGTKVVHGGIGRVRAGEDGGAGRGHAPVRSRQDRTTRESPLLSTFLDRLVAGLCARPYLKGGQGLARPRAEMGGHDRSWSAELTLAYRSSATSLLHPSPSSPTLSRRRKTPLRTACVRNKSKLTTRAKTPFATFTTRFLSASPARRCSRDFQKFRRDSDRTSMETWLVRMVSFGPRGLAGQRSLRLCEPAMSGITIGVQTLMDHPKVKNFTKDVFLLTDGESESDWRYLQATVDKMNEQRISLTVMCVLSLGLLRRTRSLFCSSQRVQLRRRDSQLFRAPQVRHQGAIQVLRFQVRR